MPGKRLPRCSTDLGLAHCWWPRFCAHAPKPARISPASTSGCAAIARERRRAFDPTTRLIGFLDAATAAATAGLKEHDRLMLARAQLQHRLGHRRKTSHLPALIDLVLARPLVSTTLIADELAISARAAQNLVTELGLRELTGRGRYRAWGI